jgi:hypothetical protein
VTINTDSSGQILLAIVLAVFLFSGSPDVTDALVCWLMDTCATFQPKVQK